MPTELRNFFSSVPAPAAAPAAKTAPAPAVQPQSLQEFFATPTSTAPAPTTPVPSFKPTEALAPPPLSELQQALGVAPEAAARARMVQETKQHILAEELRKIEGTEQYGAFARGLQAGGIGLKETLQGLKALGATVFDNEEELNEAADSIARLGAQREVLRPRLPTVRDLITRDDATFADYLEWAAFSLGEQVPNMATVVTGGGFGALFGRQLGKLSAKQAITDIEARAILRKFTDRTAKTGAYLAATGLETSGTAQEELEATGKITPLVSLAAGAAKGALEIATPAAIATRFGMSESMGSKLYGKLIDTLSKGGFVRRTTGGALAVSTGEAITEGMQETVDVIARNFVDENFELLGVETAWRILNSAAVGGLVGGVAGGVTGAATRPVGEQKPLSREELEAFLKQPMPSFQQPGAYAVGDPTVAAPTVFVPSFEAETAPSAKEKGVYQVDMAQVDPAAVSARLENLPGKGVIHEQANTALPVEVHDRVTKAIELLQGAERLQFHGATPEERTRNQIQAAKMMELAQANYQAAVDAGFRYMPEAGVAELQKTGMVLPTGFQLPPTAMRRLESTGEVFDPNDMVSIKYDTGKKDKVFEGSIAPRTDTDAFVLRSELSEDQISTHPVYFDAFFQPERVRFAPWVKEEEKAKLQERLYNAGQITDPVIRKEAYRDVVRKGVRYKPLEGQKLLLVMDAKPRPVPGEMLKKGTQALWRASQYQNFHAEMNEPPKAAADDYKGTDYNYAEHKPGTVVLIGVEDIADPAERSMARKAEKLLQELVRRTMSDMRLVLDTRRERNNSFIGSFAEYSGRNKNGGWGQIWLNPRDAFRSEAVVSHIIFHEFGHIVSGHLLDKADIRTQSAIFTAWLRHMHAQQRQTGSEFWLAFADMQRLIDPDYYVHTVGAPSASEALAERFSNWYQFDEWFAENTAKWMEEPTSSARTLAEVFFKKLGDLLLKAWEKIRSTFGQDPVPIADVVRDFLESVYDKRGTGHQPAIAVAGGTESMVQEEQPEVPAKLSVGPSMKLLNKKQKEDVDKYSWYVRWGWNILQLAAKNQHIAGLQHYVEQTRLWHREKMKWITRADERVVAWRNLGKEQAQRLGDFIWELETMPYLKPGEKPRQPTDVELIGLADKYKLSREALQVWKEIKGDFDAVLDEIEKVWVRDAIAAFPEFSSELTAAVLNIKKEMTALRSKPYYPHARFGDWTVAVRDPTGKLLSFKQFENKKAQERGYIEAKKDFPDASIQMGKMDEDMGIFRGLPAGLIDSIAAKMKLTPAQLQILEEIKFDMSPANSWGKHLKKRKGTPGWSTDAIRTYGNYFFHAGHHLARIIHRPGLEAAVEEVRSSRMELVDARKRDEIVGYLNRHLQYILYPPNELAGVRAIGAQWLLGFAPDSAFVNFTQVPLVAAPYLSARFDDVRTIGYLSKAAKDLWKLYNSKNHADQIETDVYDAQQLAIEQGIVDQSYAAELAATAHGNSLTRFVGGSAIERTIGGLGRAAMFMFRTTERINRVVVFDAAYQLGRDAIINVGKTSTKTLEYIEQLSAASPTMVTDLELKGWTEAQIAGFLVGRDAVERTMFEYSQWARPEFMRGKKGALFTFFMFLQNMLWFTRYSQGNKRYLALLLAASGIMGLPLAEDLDDVLKFIISKMIGKYFDPEMELRKIVAEMGGDPTLVARGFGANSFGLQALGEMTGIPIPGIDVSRRLGMGRVVPGVEPLTMLGASWEDRIARTTEDVIGASYGIPYNFVQAVAGFEHDNFKSYERLMPRAFKNMARAVRWGVSGEETSGSGAVMRRFDPEDPRSMVEVGLGALGFMPSELMMKWDSTRAKQEVTRYWTAQKGILYDQFFRATNARDREGIADVRASIKKYNNWVPEPGLRIRADDLRQSLASRRRGIAKEERGLPQQKRLTRTMRGVEEAFPTER